MLAARRHRPASCIEGRASQGSLLGRTSRHTHTHQHLLALESAHNLSACLPVCLSASCSSLRILGHVPVPDEGVPSTHLLLHLPTSARPALPGRHLPLAPRSHCSRLLPNPAALCARLPPPAGAPWVPGWAGRRLPLPLTCGAAGGWPAGPAQSSPTAPTWTPGAE